MIVSTDASLNNEHNAGIGWHIQEKDAEKDYLLVDVDSGYDFLSGKYTSEEAEMQAIIRGVEEVLRQGERHLIRIRSDCQPLVEKIQRGIALSDSNLMEDLQALLSAFGEWEIRYCGREKNTYADRLAHCGKDRKP